VNEHDRNCECEQCLAALCGSDVPILSDEEVEAAAPFIAARAWD
jgi:hypothetical protein